MYAYALNTTPLSQLNLSPYQLVFHTQHRIQLPSSLNLLRNYSKVCIATYCDSHPPQTSYSDNDLNTFLTLPSLNPFFLGFYPFNKQG